ncbi:hypothetical protein QJS04_geneDACA013002 [Acorus gramineus]|uniref:Choline transporter-like protein n=1 Tax=Acorus gramineus TaxID=55184 RepID=A0AAV9B7M0_ACOGR|nr:hypothetical protein QJS04_geneDACA013002 [Acorus gramineus]
MSNPHSNRRWTTLFKLAFFAHLFVTSVLVAFFSIRGLIFSSHRFSRFYLPLLASSLFSALPASAFLFSALHRPSAAIKAAMWLAPSLSLSLGLLLLAAGDPPGLALAVVAIASALAQSLYACWASPRLPFAAAVLSTATRGSGGAGAGAATLAALYAAVWACGVSGLATKGYHLAPLFVLTLLLGLAWPMQTIRTVAHVAVSGMAYASLGAACAASMAVPAVCAVRGAARAMGLVAGGDADEFLFSCTDCFSGLAGRMVARANRWGLVHVARKGFVRASEEAWEAFGRVGMGRLIEVDLTSSFCFLSGVAGGALSGIVGGAWALVVHKELTAGVSAYAFLIGYFVTRIAMVWPQACVTAYYVAYAEDPGSARFDLTIPNRIRELQASGD